MCTYFKGETDAAKICKKISTKSVSNRSGGILVYVKSSIPSRRLSCENLCDSIQAVLFEINLRKEKWLVISIYRPPSDNSEYF